MNVCYLSYMPIMNDDQERALSNILALPAVGSVEGRWASNGDLMARTDRGDMCVIDGSGLIQPINGDRLEEGQFWDFDDDFCVRIEELTTDGFVKFCDYDRCVEFSSPRDEFVFRISRFCDPERLWKRAAPVAG